MRVEKYKNIRQGNFRSQHSWANQTLPLLNTISGVLVLCTSSWIPTESLYNLLVSHARKREMWNWEYSTDVINFCFNFVKIRKILGNLISHQTNLVQLCKSCSHLITDHGDIDDDEYGWWWSYMMIDDKNCHHQNRISPEEAMWRRRSFFSEPNWWWQHFHQTKVW